MTPLTFQTFYDDLTTFTDIETEPAYIKIPDGQFGEEEQILTISSIKRKNSLVVLKNNNNEIRYAVADTDYQNTHAYVSLNRHEFDDTRCFSIQVRLMYGSDAQMNDKIKYFYSNYKVICKVHRDASISIVEKQGFLYDKEIEHQTETITQKIIHELNQYISSFL